MPARSFGSNAAEGFQGGSSNALLVAAMDQAEASHMAQMRREVENAARNIQVEDARCNSRQGLEARSDSALQRREPRCAEATHRTQLSRQQRLHEATLAQDELLLDERLHKAMEAKLGRLTYLREHARATRLFAAARSALARNELRHERDLTLSNLLKLTTASSGVGSAASRPTSSTSAAVLPVRLSISHAEEDKGDVFDSPQEPRSITHAPPLGQQQARQSSVERFLAREESGSRFHPNAMTAKMLRGQPSQARCHSASDALHAGRGGSVPTPQHQQEDTVDWAEPAGAGMSSTGSISTGGVGGHRSTTSALLPRPSRGASTTSKSHRIVAAARGVSSLSYGDRIRSTLTVKRASSGNTANYGARVVPRPSSRQATPSRFMQASEAEQRSKLMLPPLPALLAEPHGSSTTSPVPEGRRALILPPGGGATRHGSGDAASQQIVDPFPEENEHAYLVLQQYQQQQRVTTPLNFQRRPNSRGIEERKVFEKHSMDVMRELLLGRAEQDRSRRVETPNHTTTTTTITATINGQQPRSLPLSRAATPQQPEGSMQLSVTHVDMSLHHTVTVGTTTPVVQSNHIPRTVRAASPSSDMCATGGICPPLSNRRGELDAFQRTQQRVTRGSAQSWLRLFGRGRSYSPPRTHDDNDDDEDAFEVLPAPANRHAWTDAGDDGGLGNHEENEDEDDLGFDADDGEPIDDDIDDSSVSSCSTAPETDEVIPAPLVHERLEYEMVDMTLPIEFQDRPQAPDGNARRGAPSDKFDAQRRQLVAHHGGFGGNSPQRAVPDATSHRSPSRSPVVNEPSSSPPPAIHQQGAVTSVLPRHEPDFSFETFFSGGFEQVVSSPTTNASNHKQQQYPAATPAAVASRPTVNSEQQPTTPSVDDDDPFPAPPTNASRFADFDSDSESEYENFAAEHEKSGVHDVSQLQHSSLIKEEAAVVELNVNSSAALATQHQEAAIVADGITRRTDEVDDVAEMIPPRDHPSLPPPQPSDTANDDDDDDHGMAAVASSTVADAVEGALTEVLRRSDVTTHDVEEQAETINTSNGLCNHHVDRAEAEETEVPALFDIQAWVHSVMERGLQM